MVIRLIVLLLVLQTLGACASIANINVKDNVTFNDIEASFPVSENRGDRIRLRATTVGGSYTQTLDEGHFLINGIAIWSPATVSGDTEIDYQSIDYGWDNLDITSGSVFVYFGLQRTQLDLSLKHAGTLYKITDSVAQLHFEVGFRTLLTDTFTAEVSNSIGLSGQGSTMNQIDLKLIYPAGDYLRITAGYRFYAYNYQELADTSDIIVEFNGPFIGLNLGF